MKQKKTTLHLGCGPKKIPGSVGIDINKNIGADIVQDLNKFPYPFKANLFDEVVAENIFEHLDNIIQVMEEIHRIAKNGARILITTGHFSGVDSFTDPDHKHFFTSRTFDYFIPGTDLYKYHYSRAKYKKISVKLGPAQTTNQFLKMLMQLINKYQIFYEKRFAFIFPVGVIKYELEIIKE